MAVADESLIARPVAPPAKWTVIGVGAVLAVGLGGWIFAVGGGKTVILYILGLLLGLVLFHSRFGFTSAWRQLVAVGQPRALRAHMLMLAVACVLFAILLGGGIGFGVTPQPLLQPVGAGVVVGAFLFGVGMQLGGSC